MKKVISILLLIATLLVFSSCGCQHEWGIATCSAPKTCMNCGKTKGEIAQGQHQWAGATCIAPRTCVFCGQTEGMALTTHSFVNDKCESCGTIQLTLDNYKKYLTVDATLSANSMYYDVIRNYVYTSVDCQFKTTGDSHYKYENVSFVVRFAHYDKEGRMQKFINEQNMISGKPITTEAVPYSKAERTANLNIAGNSSVTCVVYTPWLEETSTYLDSKAIYNHTYYEVISVTGTVTEYD